jgi:hypothetical protein
VLIPDDGRRIEQTATVTLSRGVATGSVTFTSTGGSFEPPSPALVDGAAKSTFSCDVGRDSRCRGPVEVRATWESLEATRTILVQRVARPDAGAPDAGVDGGAPDAGDVDAGGMDAGSAPGRRGDVWIFSTLANTPDQQSLVAINLDGDAGPFLLPVDAINCRVRGDSFIYQLGEHAFEATPDDWSVYTSGDAGGNDVLLPTVCVPATMETSADGRWAYTCWDGGGVFDGDTGALLSNSRLSAITPYGVFDILQDGRSPSNSLMVSSLDRYDGDGGLLYAAWLFGEGRLELRRVPLAMTPYLSTAVGDYALPDAGYDMVFDPGAIAPDGTLWIATRATREIWQVPLKPGSPRLVFRFDNSMTSRPLAMPPELYPALGRAGMSARP